MDNLNSFSLLPDELVAGILQKCYNPLQFREVCKKFYNIVDQNFAFYRFLSYSSQPFLNKLTKKINDDHKNCNFIQKISVLYRTIIEFAKDKKLIEEQLKSLPQEDAIAAARLKTLVENLEVEKALQDSSFFYEVLDTAIPGLELFTQKDQDELSEMNQGARDIFIATRYREAINNHAAKIKTICLSKFFFRIIPKEIYKFNQLTKIYLDHGDIDKLPPEIGLLENLTEAFLIKNNIQKIPAEIGLLTKLRILSLAHNPIGKIPPEISKLTNLTKLGLNNCSILISPDIGKLTNLTTLDLSDNKIQDISEINKLQRLAILHLGFNKIEHISIGIGKLAHLTYLDLAHNPIKSIPPDFAELKKLKILNFFQLDEISHSLRNSLNNIQGKLPELFINFY